MAATAASVLQPIEAVQASVETPAIIFYEAPLQTMRFASPVGFGPLPVHADDPIIWAHILDLTAVPPEALTAYPRRNAYALRWDGENWLTKTGSRNLFARVSVSVAEPRQPANRVR